MKSKDYYRKKIADATGETESGNPIHNIKINGDRSTIDLKIKDEVRTFSFDKNGDEWEFSGEVIK